MNAWRALFVVVALMGVSARPGTFHSINQPACAAAPGWLFIERDARAFVLEPNATTATPLDVPPPIVERLHDPLKLDTWFRSPNWDVQRDSGPDGYQFSVRDPATGDVILSATFDRRIEIAASTVSPSGRFTVFIQSNNLASELTLLDAADASRQDIRIPHGEELAAFAIGSAFSRDERCLAVSMERIGGNGPETWLVDLVTGDVSLAIPGFVIAWA